MDQVNFVWYRLPHRIGKGLHRLAIGIGDTI